MDQELGQRIDLGRQILEPISKGINDITPVRSAFYTWDEYNTKLLARRFTTSKIADEYKFFTIPMGGDAPLPQQIEWLVNDVNRQVRKLESIRLQLDLYESVISLQVEDSPQPSLGNKIFLVHGHDGDTKQQVARFVEQISGERPIILHEQSDSGRTVIEKFEAHADEVGFAVILLTGDDEGQKKGVDSLNLRARQNVVFEFGYFMGRLGRSRVVALHEANVELPSDVAGILYKSLAGNWMVELAGEIKAAGIKIDLGKAKH